jgi:proline racemase
MTNRWAGLRYLSRLFLTVDDCDALSGFGRLDAFTVIESAIVQAKDGVTRVATEAAAIPIVRVATCEYRRLRGVSIRQLPFS